MPELTPEQKAQLDKNIRSMLSQGASENDVVSYTKDFRTKYDIPIVEKKNQFGNVSSNGVEKPSFGANPFASPSTTQSELPENKLAPSGQADYSQQQPQQYSDGNTLGYNVQDVGDVKPPEKSVPFGKAAVLGLSNMASSTLKSIGIAAKQLDFFNEYDDKKVEDLATYKVGQWIDDKVKDLVGDLSPEEQDMFAVKLTQAGMQMVGFALGGIGAKVLKMSPALTVAGLGAAVGGESEYEAAIQSGATPDKASKVFWLNAALNTTEAFPMMSIFRKMDKYTDGLATGLLAKKLSSTVGGRIGNDMAIGIVSEVAQEVGVQAASNVVAAKTYDTTRKIYDGLVETAAISTIIGGAMNGVASTIRERRSNGGLTKEEDLQLAEAQKFAEEKAAEALDPDKAEVTTPTSDNPKVKAIIKAKTDIEADLASNDKLPEETKATMQSEVAQLNNDLEAAKSETYQQELNSKAAIGLEEKIKTDTALLEDKTISESTRNVIQKQIDTNKAELEQIKPPQEEIKQVPKAEPIVDEIDTKRVDDLFNEDKIKSSTDGNLFMTNNQTFDDPYTGEKRTLRGRQAFKVFKQFNDDIETLINCK